MTRFRIVLRFLPRRIGGVDFEIQKITASNLIKVIDAFFDARKEKKAEFKKSFQSYCSDSSSQSKVISRENKLIAFFAFKIQKATVKVDFIRLKNLSIKYILFNQLITEIIRIAISLDLEEIQINKNEICKDFEELLLDFKFYQGETCFHKIVLSGAFLSKEMFSSGKLRGIINQSQIGNIVENEQKYELERVIYPGKIKDLEIQNLIIPIKPYWASQLFDFYLSRLTLFGANEKLLWNRKNVYFRSIKPNIEKYPARILWYVSSDKNGRYGNRPKGIVGCSYLEGIHIDIPKSLFSQFKRVGIYSWSNILELSKDNLKTNIKAIEFSDTEVFKKSISLSKVQQVLEKKHTFQSPLKISSEQFFSIYSLK